MDVDINFGKKIQLSGLKKNQIQDKMTPFTWQ
jgi:hypothetical protein